MKHNPPKKTKIIKPPANLSINEKQDKSLQEMAVLFTDIVGSTEFFQSHGDVNGRKMLQQHLDIASLAISEHGGILVKSLGDSVMAYFLNSKEALKSAIKIQQKSLISNRGKEQQDQVHVRIGIHFGETIVEDKDIFGSAVNIASKLTALAAREQIYISREMHGLVHDLTAVKFEVIDIPGIKDFPEEFGIYRVVWEESVAFDPTVKTILYFKPVWKLSDDNFTATWNRLLREKDKYWGDRIERESILPDRSVALIVKEPQSVIAVVRDVIKFLRENLGPLVLPIQTIIDSGPYLRADKPAVGDIKVNWGEIDPGEIYISSFACGFIKDDGTFSITPSPDTDRPQSFCKLTFIEDRQRSEQHIFLYHDALIQGKNPPCYYCGDKKHQTTNCPSKKLPPITDALNKLGYLSLDTINHLFFKYLAEESSDVTAELETGKDKDAGSSTMLAQYGFYDLKRVFQIRFFRTIWDVGSNIWDNVKKSRDDEGKGGFAWLAYDCLRVSNLPQAESFLKTSLEEETEDYKVYCAMGFLNVEQNNDFRAEYYFSKALDYAKYKPQKIFLLLLLSRLYDLNGDYVKAREKINDITPIDPDCPEAAYQDIIFKFRQGRKDEAIKRLIRLIQRDREYYISALIDPDLAPFSKIIHPQLMKLLNQASSDAKRIAHEAKEGLEKLKKVLDKEDKEIVETQSLKLKIEELLKTDSYFGYLDTIQYGNFIISVSRKNLENRRKKLLDVLHKLNKRFKGTRSFAANYRYRNRISPAERQLGILQTEINQTWNMAKSSVPDKFQDVYARCKEISFELDQIESKLKRLKTLRQIDHFMTMFFKYFLIFQATVLFVALVLFPILTFYLKFFPPKFNIPFIYDTWLYQKKIIIWCGMSGFLLAIFMAIRKVRGK